MSEMTELKLSNGKIAKIGYADFQDSLDLKDAIFKELSRQDIKVPGLDNVNFEEISKLEIKGDVIALIIKSILTVDSSKDITDAVNKCFEKCTYDKEKITLNTFNNIDARKFYLKIKYEVIKKNILPFFQNLASLFEKGQEAIKEMVSQKLK